MSACNQLVEALKANGAYFAAGAAAREFGLGPAYGCHFGLRATRNADMAAFRAGYDACDKGARV